MHHLNQKNLNFIYILPSSKANANTKPACLLIDDLE
jgi:hypothetical protein